MIGYEGRDSKECFKMVILSDPVEHRCDEEEPFEGVLGFFVSRCETSVAFDSGEVVFDPVPLSVISGMAGRSGFCTSPFWDGGGVSREGERVAEGVAIVPLIGDDDGVLDTGDKLWGCGDIVGVTGGDDKFYRPSVEVDQRVDLGVPTTAACPNPLAASEGERWRPVLVNADVGTIDEAKLTFGTSRHRTEKPRPEPFLAELPKASITGLPRAETARQVAPRVAAAQDVKDPFEDLPQLARRPSKPDPNAGTRGNTVNFFRPLQARSDRPRQYFFFMG